MHWKIDPKFNFINSLVFKRLCLQPSIQLENIQLQLYRCGTYETAYKNESKSNKSNIESLQCKASCGDFIGNIVLQNNCIDIDWDQNYLKAL